MHAQPTNCTAHNRGRQEQPKVRVLTSRGLHSNNMQMTTGQAKRAFADKITKTFERQEDSRRRNAEPGAAARDGSRTGAEDLDAQQLGMSIQQYEKFRVWEEKVKNGESLT